MKNRMVDSPQRKVFQMKDKDFFTQLLHAFEAQGCTLFSSRRKPITDQTLRLERSVGACRAAWNCEHNAAILVLYVRGDSRRADAEQAKDDAVRVQRLLNLRQEIERDFGGPLDWDISSTHKSKQYLRAVVPIKATKHNREQWPEIQKALVDRMLRLHRAVTPYLDALR